MFEINKMLNTMYAVNPQNQTGKRGLLVQAVYQRCFGNAGDFDGFAPGRLPGGNYNPGFREAQFFREEFAEFGVGLAVHRRSGQRNFQSFRVNADNGVFGGPRLNPAVDDTSCRILSYYGG
jgi:hypothetical protein